MKKTMSKRIRMFIDCGANKSYDFKEDVSDEYLRNFAKKKIKKIKSILHSHNLGAGNVVVYITNETGYVIDQYYM